MELISRQPERLTDDDFETIRIHLNACKEKLCIQQRWKEAEEYQRIIDRFMTFASAHPDVPDMNVGETEPSRESDTEITRCSDDTISRQAAQHKINALIDEFEIIMKDIRERHVDDSVCGLCEYDGAFMSDSGDWCNECPGFERDDCFKLKDQYREEWAGAIENLPPVQPNHNADPDKKVAAIPVEWIAKYMRSIKSGTFADPAWIIKTMLEEWKQEQAPHCGLDSCEIGGHDEQT